MTGTLHKPPSAGRVVFHTAGLFLLSFFVSSGGNVLAQLFFQRRYADHKVLLLGACLLTGTLASIAGVRAARGPVSRAVLLGALACTALAADALYLVTTAAAYVVANAAVQFGANYLTNTLDHAAVRAAGDARRRFNDRASNAARLLGMLGGPAFAAALYDRRAVVHAGLLGLSAVALASAASLSAHARAGEHADPRSAPLDAADRLFFGYAIAVYAALYLLAANLIYLLRDVVRLPSAEGRGGAIIALVFAAAVAGNLLFGALRRSPGPPLGALLSPAVLLAGSAAALASGVPLGTGAVLSGAVALGLGYGAFLLGVREYASEGARAGGKRALLDLFNNMANYSSLAAFSCLVALGALRPGAAAYPWVLALAGGLPLAGAPLLLAALRRRRAGP